MRKEKEVEKETGPLFECKCCGHCCHGVATVSVTDEEQRNMAAFLGISLNQLRKDYLVIGTGSISMKIVDGHCIFYRADGLCHIHPVKPFHCKRWPLHPSILADEAAWKAIKADCPGFSPDITWEQAKMLVRKHANGS